MANISNQIGQGDVTRWGIIAMAFGGVALLSISLSGNIPQSMSVGLHATRIEGGNINLLREQVAELQSLQRQMERNAQLLDGQVRISGRDQGDMIRRLSALETAIPALLEVAPPDAELDFSLFTGAIGDQTEESFEAEGGSVSLTQRPIFEEATADIANDNGEAIPALPPSLDDEAPEEFPTLSPSAAREPNVQPETMLTATSYGLAVGAIINDETVDQHWTELKNNIGTLLIGLDPAISDPAETSSNRIIVGPISDYAAAELLCLRITEAGVSCLPVQYAEDDLRALGGTEAQSE